MTETATMDWTKERIKGIRERLGLTQRAFAEKLSVTQGFVAQWETGERSPLRYRDVQALLAAEAEAGA
jgi:DNA-binding transcriptional regulator YiaG